MAMEGRGTLSEIYQRSKKLLLRTRDGLEGLERLEFSSPSGIDSPELSFAIKRDITQIQSLCVEMDRLWRSIASKPQRDLWKRKVEQVAEEVDSLKESLDKHFLRNQKRMMEAKERAQLLEKAEAQAMQSARNSSLILEEAYSTGVAILSKYAEQRDHLKVQISGGHISTDGNQMGREDMTNLRKPENEKIRKRRFEEGKIFDERDLLRERDIPTREDI